MSAHHRTVGLGGTFDHFHEGHQLFLETAAQYGDELWIGVTTQDNIGKKDFLEVIEPQDTRIASVESFVKERGIRARVFSLTDQYGPTLEDDTIEAVAVTPHSRLGGEAINRERAARGLMLLPIYECPLKKDQTGVDLSSTRIRAGVANRQGAVYVQQLLRCRALSQSARAFFSNPQGEVTLKISDKQAEMVRQRLAFAVGDRVSEHLLSEQLPADMLIIDGHTHRQPYTGPLLQQYVQKKLSEPGQHLMLSNPAGSISHEMIEYFSSYFSLIHTHLTEKTKTNAEKQPSILKVDGEEDVATIALVLLAPLESIIIYGQPEMGMVVLEVSEKLKKTFLTQLQL